MVLAASYEAKAFGVRTAMSGAAARRACPNLIEVPARFDAYTEASKDVFDIFRDTSPIVEPMSIDEAFIDVAGLWRIAGSPTEIAVGLRRRIADEVGLPISVGVARTKFLAKVASAVSKPDGLLVVEPDGELDFLHPLPVQRLWGVGTVTATKLHERGIHTVAEVATMSPDTLVAIVGRSMGHQLHALAHNRDARRVTTGRRRGSIGHNRHSADVGGHATRSTSSCGGSSIESPVGCGEQIVSVARSRCGCVSTTSPERHARTRSPMPARQRR